MLPHPGMKPYEPRADDPEELRLEGTVISTVFHNPQTRYSVLRVQMPGEAGPSTWVGRSSAVDNGASISAAGEWAAHPVHGRQFAFSRLLAKVPSTPLGIARRLERYPGLGADKAAKIVAMFGPDTLTILDKQPRRLLEVEGIGPKTLEKLLLHHAERHGPVVEVENQLLELDMSTSYAEAIVDRFGDEALKTLRERPYLLARKVRGIGFLTADRIARSLGVALDSDDRIDAGLVHAFEQAENDGHCALPETVLLQIATRLLELPGERVAAGIERLLATEDIVRIERDQAPPLYYPQVHDEAERFVAEGLADLAIGGHERPRWRAIRVPDDLSPGQVAAVAAIADAGLLVLTGGPGTGKSTVTRQIIQTALANDTPVMLAAPTGRAAKRLAEATGQRATTIHRLLEIQGNSGQFTFHAGHPLDRGLVVIDESSMLDLALASSLLSALTPEHRLLLVGDADQLPSVGPGNVLRDIIAAASRPDAGEAVPVVRLTQIFRQAEGSSIVVAAHEILHGRVPVSDRSNDGQFYIIHARDAERAHDLVVKVVTERIPQAYGLDPVTQVQVLCPMHKGKAGTEALNRSLQAHHTTGRPELALAGFGRYQVRVFRVGDRVMQTRNDHERGVFNGDIGVVTEVSDEPQGLTVEIDGIAIRYDHKQAGALQLAYAVSIHKSQGSEFPAVVIPLLSEHHVMLRRNLLYTAVTRARQLCVVVGDPRAITQAVHRGDAASRYTGLAQRLQDGLRARLGEPKVIEVD